MPKVLDDAAAIRLIPKMNLIVKIAVAWLCLASFELVQAAEEVIELWPAGAPGEKEEIGQEHDATKLEDRSVAGKRVVRLTNVSKPTISIYRPTKRKDTGTC